MAPGGGASGGPGAGSAAGMVVAPAPGIDPSQVFLTYRSQRTRVLATLAVVGAILAVLGVAKVADWYLYRPVTTVRAYFDALADRDASAAARQLDPHTPVDPHTPAAGGYRSGALPLPDEALRSPDYQPPTDPRIDMLSADELLRLGEGEEADPDVAYARVEVGIGEGRQILLLQLRRADSSSSGLFRRWRIVDGRYPLEVSGGAGGRVLVAGVEVEPAGGSGPVRVAAFPGRYRVGLPDDPLLKAEPVTVEVAGQGAGVDLVPTVRTEARQEVDRQVRAYLDGCAQRTELAPEGCPLSSYAYSEVRDVRWTIIAYPQVVVKIDSTGSAAARVRTVTPGQAEVVAAAVRYDGSTTEYRDTVEVAVSGLVTVAGQELTFQAD